MISQGPLCSCKAEAGRAQKPLTEEGRDTAVCRPALRGTPLPTLGRMLGSPHISLPGGLFVLLLQVSLWVSDSFLVVGPSEPVVAMLGADAVLPCYVDPAMSVEDMELRWYRSQFSEAVHVYQDGGEQTGQQLADFNRRTELLKDRMSEGRVAVKIYHLRVSDNGMYRCFFRKGSDFEEATLELRVIGLGFGPHILIVGPEDKGIKLTCTGKGWFPKPQIQWKDAQGERMRSVSEDETQGDDGLFQVEASLIVRDRVNTKVSCSMKNPFLAQEQVKTISIPEPFFPRASFGNGLAFGLTFFFLSIFLIAALVLAWWEKQKKRSVQKDKEDEMKERRAKESLQKISGGYCLSMKTSYPHVDVSLALRTPDSSLTLLECKKCISLQENVYQSCNDLLGPWQEETEPKFSALGHNFFTTGKHYWEVKLKGTGDGAASRWDVGVYSKRVKKTCRFSKIPNKFWVLTVNKNEIWAQVKPPKFLFRKQHPHRIGFFLDCEDGVLSFYDMDKGSHIFSFVGITIHGALRPFFRLQGPDTSVTICSAPDHVQSCSESPSNRPTNLRNSDTGVPQETQPFLPS